MPITEQKTGADKSALTLQAQAVIDLAAGADGKAKRPTFTAEAYTGGALELGWGSPVVIDLAGFRSAEPVTILADHDNAIGAVVGQSTGIKVTSRVVVEGIITGDEGAEPVKTIMAHARNGFQWPVSIGATVEKLESIGEKTAVNVNSRDFDGPLYVVRAALLREVSFVGVGADEAAAAKIAAQRNALGAGHMADKTDVDTIRAEATTAERKRMADIEAACAGLEGERVAELKALAVAGGSVEDLRAGLLDHLRMSRPKAPAAIVHGGGLNSRDVLVAGFLHRAGQLDLAGKDLPAPAREAGRRFRHMADICEASLRLSGQAVPNSRSEMIRASFSATDLPVALGVAANKILLAAYAESVPTWRSFATIKPARDFKTHTAIRAVQGGQLEQVPPGGELKHGTIEESTYPFQVDTFGEMLRITRQDVINDDTSLFADTAAALGRKAGRGVSDLFYGVLLGDDGTFFSLAHGNYLTGDESALSATSLALAIRAIRCQRDGKDNDLGLVPRVLLVPPTLEMTARALIASAEIQAAEGSPMGNALKDVVTVETEPRLENDTKYANASATQWFLSCGPGDGALIVAFLDGKQVPTVEVFGFDSDVETLGMSYRV